ncbi:hypothetical protein JCM33374_g4535 [Metschnikowia sp. JCM 33374]|nr:hypothetical protein JCM33374_g4535 [Metschnikowia sp. JCM 33374]
MNKEVIAFTTHHDQFHFDDGIQVYSMTVAEAVQFMERIQGFCPYTRKKCMETSGHVLEENRKYVKMAPNSAGSDLYRCQFAGKPPVSKDAKNKNKKRKCDCKAKATIKFPPLYKHDKNNQINCRDHGNEIVSVTWHWEHNHDARDTFQHSGLPNHIKTFLSVSVSKGMTWGQVQAKIHFDSPLWGDDYPQKVLKIEYFHYQSLRKKAEQDLAIRHTCTQESLRILAQEINDKGGMADFKEEPHFLKDLPGVTEFQTEKGKPIWSMTWMTAWQRKVLAQDGAMMYFDSTHSPSHGLDRSENASLFTIAVKSTTTGQCVPAAFLLTNSPHHHVISDFLKKVHQFVAFEPKTVMLGCDAAEKIALRKIWPGADIVRCHGHVMKAARQTLPSEVKRHLPEHELSEVHQQIRGKFRHVLDSETSAEAESRMSHLQNQYGEYGGFIDYMSQQWVNNIDSLWGKYWPMATTNSYLESLNSRWQHSTLKSGRNQRPDVLVHKSVLDLGWYRTAELKVTRAPRKRTHDDAEKAAMAQADKFLDDEVLRRVVFLSETEFSVLCFTNAWVSFLVTFEPHQERAFCTCRYWNEGDTWCGHIFLAQYWSNLSLKSLGESAEKSKSLQKSDKKTAGSGALTDDALASPEIGTGKVSQGVDMVDGSLTDPRPHLISLENDHDHSLGGADVDVVSWGNQETNSHLSSSFSSLRVPYPVALPSVPSVPSSSSSAAINVPFECAKEVLDCHSQCPGV